MNEETQYEVGVIPQDDGTIDITIHDPIRDLDAIGNGPTEGEAFAAAMDDLRHVAQG